MYRNVLVRSQLRRAPYTGHQRWTVPHACDLYRRRRCCPSLGWYKKTHVNPTSAAHALYKQTGIKGIQVRDCLPINKKTWAWRWTDDSERGQIKDSLSLDWP